MSKQVRQVLRARLQGASELPAGPVLEELEQKTELRREEVQARLSAWLDSLEVCCKEKRGEWEKLVNSGGVQTTTKQAERVLNQFIGQARQALEKQTGRSVEEIVDQAPKKAQFLTYQGRDLLLKLLSEAPALPLPEKVGLLVEVRILMKGDHGFWCHRDPDGNWVKITGSNFHEVLLPVLVEELGASARERYALQRPKPGLQPDWRLVVELRDLSSNNGSAYLLTGEVVLSDLKTHEELCRRPLQVNDHHSADELDWQKHGDMFLGDAALKIRQVFEQYWTGK